MSPYHSGHYGNNIHTLYEIVSSRAKRMDTICARRNAFPTEETRCQPRPFGPKNGGMERGLHAHTTPNGDVQQRKRTRRYSRFFAPAPKAGYSENGILPVVYRLFLVQNVYSGRCTANYSNIHYLGGVRGWTSPGAGRRVPGGGRKLGIDGERVPTDAPPGNN